jgi:hypothetical protein
MICSTSGLDITTVSWGSQTVWPTGVSRPTASDLNWVAGQTVPNLVVATLGSDGAIQVFNAAGSVDVVVDVSGWHS